MAHAFTALSAGVTVPLMELVCRRVNADKPSATIPAAHAANLVFFIKNILCLKNCLEKFDCTNQF
jgi:hypothetical protein